MRTLLANSPSPYVRCRWDIKLQKLKYFPFPTRLAYATSVLKKHGYDAHMVDGFTEELTIKQFAKRFKEINPDLLIWETTASSFDKDVETLKLLKKMKSDLLVGTSGYHATATFKECLKAGYDFVIVGECEYSILDLVKWLSKETKKFPIGVVDKKHKLVPRPLIQNIDELPWPERDSLPMRKYNDPKLYGFNVVLISTRGCPWGCSFCTEPVYYSGSNYRMRDPKKVVDEMEYLWNKYKPDELYFDDSNFAVNEKHVKDICEEIIRRKLNIKWDCMVDAKISEDLIKTMKRAGCIGITIGAESADDNVLKHLGKPIRREDIKNFVLTCKKLRIRTHICWVLGLPHSTKESDMDTIKFALDLPSDTLQFSLCVPFPGTKMYDWCIENDYLVTKDWRGIKGNDRCIVDLPGYNHKEVKALQNYALKLWNKKMVFRRPDIIIFHLYNLYKYQGLKGIVQVTKKSLKKLV